MHLRRLAVAGRAFIFFALAAVLFPTQAIAAPKDGQAESAYKKAMEEDYLDTKFDDAQKKLEKAIDTCGEKACSPKVKAKLYLGLGIILAGGKNKLDEAKEAFGEALKLDPNAQPDADYVKSEIKFAFEEAKGGGGKKPKNNGGSGGSEPVESGPMSHTPPAEQKVNSPIPIYVTFDDETLQKVASVTAMYVGVKGGEAKPTKLNKSNKLYRGTIPCSATTETGTVKYWIVAKDANDKQVGNIGSENQPNKTEIKSILDGKPPSWPGFGPPDSCGESDEDLRAKSSQRQCVDNGDCPVNEKCTENICLLKPGEHADDADSGSTGDDKGAKKRRHWITLSFQPDFPVVSGDNVCSKAGQNEQHYVCIRENGTRYTGTPTEGQGNNVNGGLGLGTMRLMLGYDGVIVDNFSLGARVGYAFNGTSDGGAKFLPVHLEGRAKYAFGSKAYTGAIVRPWIFLNGGLAQVDSKVDVQVVEDGEVCGAENPKSFKSPCQDGYDKAGGKNGNERIQTLKAAKQAGQGFVGGGAGISFLPAKMFAIDVAFHFSATLPVFVPVLSPEAGVSVGF